MGIKVTEHASVGGSNWRDPLCPECQLTSRQNYEKIVHVFRFHGNKLPYPVKEWVSAAGIRTKIT